MGRDNLTKARNEAGLTQREFAKQVGVRQATASNWESGKENPYPHQYPLIRGILKSNDPYLFDTSGSIMDKIRRNLLELLGLAGIAVPASTIELLIPQPAIYPEQYLAQCSSTMKTCWKLLNSVNFETLKELLDAHTPILSHVAMVKSPYQATAADLMVQAKVMQIIFDNRDMDYSTRETHCLEAVNYGRITGSPFALAAAQSWQGDTYIYCYRQPEKAIPILIDALDGLTEEAKLNKSAICNKLAIAHAQQGNEKQARDYMDMARAAMPKHPELEPFYQCMHGRSELDQFEGKMYLFLAEHCPNNGYAKKAFDAFNLSLSSQAKGKGFTIQALMYRADAARAIGDLRQFADSLEQAVRLAKSKMRLHEAYKILGSVPEKWQHEARVKTLRQELGQTGNIAM